MWEVADLADRFPTKEEMMRAFEGYHGAEVQKKYEKARVAVCGLGGLGSNIALSLARAGIGTLHLIDFDTVSLSNLNRQQYAVSQLGKYKTEALRENLLAVAPYINLVTDTVRITEDNIEELLKEADVICEAFDGAEQKAMLVNCVSEMFPKKYLVSGSGMAGFSSANSIRTRKVAGRFYLCGDENSDVSDNIGLLSSRVMICAAHEAHMVLRILAEKYEP